MVILPNDPLSEYFRNSSLKESEMYTYFITWKFIMLKESALTRFVKIKDSSYILAVELFSPYQTLFGLWNIDTDQGYVFDGYNIDLFKAKHTFEVMPSTQLSASSEFMYSRKDQIHMWAFDLTKAMLNSKEHQNKTSDEIAIKAVKVAASLRDRISEYNAMKNSID